MNNGLMVRQRARSRRPKTESLHAEDVELAQSLLFLAELEINLSDHEAGFDSFERSSPSARDFIDHLVRWEALRQQMEVLRQEFWDAKCAVFQRVRDRQRRCQ